MSFLLRRSAFFRLVCLALFAAVPGAPSSAQVSVQPVTYRGWGGALRLSNDTVEIVVVPAVGRIMRYGLIGGGAVGRNLIWEDPLLAGKPADPTAFPRFGGNKAWPWPQNEWPDHIGHDWPPPPAADQVPFRAEVVGTDTVRMTSPPVAGFGLRIVRTIRLAPTGTRATITTRLVHVAAAGPPQNVGAWSVTPAAAPDLLLVHVAPAAAAAAAPVPAYKPLGSFDPFASITAESGVLNIVRDPARSSKVGVDGDVIGALYDGDLLWTLRDETPGGAVAFAPGERVQVYANADSREDAARGLPPYMELERTGPRRSLSAPGDTATLTEVWEIVRLARGEDPRTAFARKVQEAGNRDDTGGK